jgi:hypothetical protein
MLSILTKLENGAVYLGIAITDAACHMSVRQVIQPSWKGSIDCEVISDPNTQSTKWQFACQEISV